MNVPDDSSEKSIASAIIEDCHTHDLVSEINSLAQGITLFKGTDEEIGLTCKRPGAVCVFATNLGKGAEDFEVYTVNI